jgi:Ca-activated chloride channel homolog
MTRSNTYRSLLALLVFLALLGIAPSRQDKPSQPGNAPQYRFKLNVDLVVLNATVRDGAGNPVSGLSKEDFQVFEDGVPQRINDFIHEDLPVTAGLVVDNSGSMGPKREDVIAAALAFARSSNPADQMFVVNFNEHVSFALPRGKAFTDNVPELQVALSAIRANGMTALYDAVAAALEHLKKGNRDKKVLIVVSDGGDNASTRNLDQLMVLAGQSDAVIYTLGLFDESDEDRNPRVLKQLARATGGETFLPNALSEVVPICERIARDIRSQYTITYIPTNRSSDSKYRVIRMTAAAPGRGRLSVRTRAGYFVPVKTQSAPAGSAATHEAPH